MLIVELQQPTDLSVLLEWDGFGIEDEDEATLGLGWDVALGCVELAALRPGAAVAARTRRATGRSARLLPPAADPFFRAERLAPAPIAALERGFAILVVTEGAGALLSEGGEPLPVRRGDTVLVPWAAGPVPPRGRRRGDRLPSAGRGARPVTDLLLGIDVGTSACKAAVVDADGAERAHGQAPTPWRRVAHRGRDRPARAARRRARGRAAAALAAAPEGRSAGSA